jgi:hypothetical protein
MNTTNTPTNTSIETILANAADLTNWAKASAEHVGNFAAKETPLLVHEYVQYTFWSSALSVVFTLIAFGFCLYGLSFVLKRAKAFDKMTDPEQMATIFGSIFLGIGALMSAVFFFNMGLGKIDTSIKAAIAPRVLIVEKAGELLNGKRK